MTATEAYFVATVLDKHFEEIADRYDSAVQNGGGLEDVIAGLYAKADQ